VICALKSCGSSNIPKHKHLGEIELVSHRRFKGRLRKSIKKQVAGEGNQEAFMLNAVVSSPAEMASLTVQSPTRRSLVCRSVIAALALLSVAALNMFNDSAYDPATAAINASKTTPAVANEFLPPTADILAAVNVQVPEAAPYMERIKSVGHETFKDIPHKSQINRPINETMSIRFKEGFENHVPPPKFYPCAIPLLPILKEALTEMLNSGFIRPSNSPFSAPCLIIPKPHQEKVPFKDKKWRVCVDLRDVNELQYESITGFRIFKNAGVGSRQRSTYQCSTLRRASTKRTLTPMMVQLKKRLFRRNMVILSTWERRWVQKTHQLSFKNASKPL